MKVNWFIHDEVLGIRKDGGPLLLLADGFEKQMHQWLLDRQNRLRRIIENKVVLFIPAFGPLPFLFRLAGARRVVGIDCDEQTVYWQNIFTRHFFDEDVHSSFQEQFKRYQIGSVQEWTNILRTASQKPEKPLANILFQVERLGATNFMQDRSGDFDVIFCPFLFYIENGLIKDDAVIMGLRQLRHLLRPYGKLVIGPLNSNVWFHRTLISYLSEMHLQILDVLSIDDDCFFAVFQRLD